MSTKEFAEAAGEAAKNKAAEEGTKGIVSSVPVGKIPWKKLPGIAKKLKSNGEGVEVEGVKEDYGVGDGPALIVRGITRWVGVSEVPPLAEIAIGIAKTVKDAK